MTSAVREFIDIQTDRAVESAVDLYNNGEDAVDAMFNLADSIINSAKALSRELPRRESRDE